ncbi:MAG: hypothetical protein JNM36_11450 [Chitinophagales bacterium]|nr:hypothetical protein [Chitinophagales bacterium]
MKPLNNLHLLLLYFFIISCSNSDSTYIDTFYGYKEFIYRNDTIVEINYYSQRGFGTPKNLVCAKYFDYDTDVVWVSEYNNNFEYTYYIPLSIQLQRQANNIENGFPFEWHPYSEDMVDAKKTYNYKRVITKYELIGLDNCIIYGVSCDESGNIIGQKDNNYSVKCYLIDKWQQELADTVYLNPCDTVKLLELHINSFSNYNFGTNVYVFNRLGKDIPRGVNFIDSKHISNNRELHTITFCEKGVFYLEVRGTLEKNNKVIELCHSYSPIIVVK